MEPNSDFDYDLAWNLASKFHAGQTYGERDYTYHLTRVETSVCEAKQTAQIPYQASGSKEPFEEWFWYVRMVAVLHDILEDTPCTPFLLYTLFPDWVVDAIRDLSKVPGQTEGEYMARVRANSVARFVKLHDAKSNMEECLKRGDHKRATKYARKMTTLMESDV
jgi:(p)ppGpp synthase/HD superfamily hydrolase